MRQRWERRFLETPLTVVGRSKRDERDLYRAHTWAEANRMPFAYFRRLSPKRGAYVCDLLPAEPAWKIDEEALAYMTRGMVEAFIAKWRAEGILGRNLSFSWGVYTFVHYVPAGEEQAVHEAFCRVLGRALSERRAAV